MGKSDYAIKVQWQGAVEEYWKKRLEKSPGFSAAAFSLPSAFWKKVDNPLHVRDKYVITIFTWFFDLLWNILKFNLWELAL